MMDKPFIVNHLDHVAIQVKNLDVSSKWYERYFGLAKYKPEHWGPYPIFMLSGKTGVALFPETHGTNQHKSVDHFAFNVSNSNFLKARKYFEHVGLEYVFQDHHYFHSIYVKDPDDYTVELTTLVVAEGDFYKKGIT